MSNMAIESTGSSNSVPSDRIPVGSPPGDISAEPTTPTASEPDATETARLANQLGASTVEAAILLEFKDMQAQQRDARAEQVANRNAALAQARAAHMHRVREAREMRAAALQNAIVSGVALGASTALSGSSYQAVATSGAEIMNQMDQAWGHGAQTGRENVAAELAQSRSEYAGKREGDAGDRAQALRESQSRVLDILQETMKGQSESRAAAVRA